LCREHGVQLANLAASNKDIAMWGIVKETNVDDAGLAVFQLDYFSFPLYRDVNLAVYQAMGNRRLKLSTWNPIRWVRGYREMTARLNKKNITGNLKGEGMVQGGVLVFDKQGELRYAYNEETGTELNMEDVQGAIDSVRKEQKSEL
jgi:hypothetical protein